MTMTMQEADERQEQISAEAWLEFGQLLAGDVGERVGVPLALVDGGRVPRMRRYQREGLVAA